MTALAQAFSYREDALTRSFNSPFSNAFDVHPLATLEVGALDDELVWVLRRVVDANLL